MSDDNDTNKIVFLESTILNLTKKVSELESKLEELIEHLHNENILNHVSLLYDANYTRMYCLCVTIGLSVP